MKLLIDKTADVVAAKAAEHPDWVLGQLLTPLTRYTVWDGPFAVDNGAFSSFDAKRFAALLDRNSEHISRCLWVAMPDVPFAGRRTLECFHRWADRLEMWPLALVLQEGIEDLDIPWDRLAAVFIGGADAFKTSKAAADCIKAANILGKRTHCGRVNTPARWRAMEEMGVETCDGTGLSRYDHMLDTVVSRAREEPHPLLAEAMAADVERLTK